MYKRIVIFTLVFSIASISFNSVAKGISKCTNQSLFFTENNGQVRDQDGNCRNDIQFICQGKGLTLFIGQGEFHYQFAKLEAQDQRLPGRQLKKIKDKDGITANKPPKIETYRMDMELVGADKNAIVIASEKQVYYENYYLPGCPPSGIQAHTYKCVEYKNILPGIDWVINIKGDNIEYEFIVQPGGNPSDIKLRYNGQTSLKIDKKDGSIIAFTPLGIVKEHAPVCFMPDGAKIGSSYILQGNTLSYKVSEYNGSLVIDPYLEWGTYYGPDTNTTYFYDVINDKASIYAGGFTWSADLGTIATTGAFQTTNMGNEDGFMVKFDSSGNRIWGTYYGGTQIDWVAAITCDHKGNLYIAGSTASDSGIATPGTSEPIYIGGQWDAFLAKFDTNGVRQWGTYVGGTDAAFFDIEVGSITLDSLGHVYVSGACDDTDHIATPGCWKFIKTEGVDHYDCYLIQYDTTGSKLWGTYYGGNMSDMTGTSCSDGYFVYLSGYTLSDTGIASTTGYQPYLYGSSDAFLAKFDPSGNRIWGTYYGGEGQEEMGGVAIAGRNLYLFGTTGSDTNMVSSGCYQPVRGGGVDAFLALFETVSGNRLWGTYYGGPGDETDNYSRIATDSSENVYVTGYTASASGIASAGAWQTTFGGGVTDAMVAMYDNTGVQHWSTYYGGNGDDRANACAFDGWGVYVCGVTTSTDSIATPGSFLSTGGGLVYYEQGFIGKFAPNPLLTNTLGKTNSRLFVYPSPNKGAFTIAGSFEQKDGTVYIMVTDVNGRVILNEETGIVNGIMDKQLNLNADLPLGVYFVKVISGDEVNVIQFLKE